MDLLSILALVSVYDRTINSKAAAVLVEKVADGIGYLLKPWQIQREAKAEAEAEKIRSLSAIKTEYDSQQYRNGLAERYKADPELQRAVLAHVKKEENIARVLKEAILLLEDDAEPEKISDDWMMNFLSYAEKVTDSEMRFYWGKILAGEANKPGAFSRRTVNLMNDLDKNDALVFSKLCNFCCILYGLLPVPVIIKNTDSIFEENEINFFCLQHLCSLGLIVFSDVGLVIQSSKLQRLTSDNVINFVISYFDEKITIKIQEDKSKLQDIDMGPVLLSQAGRELYRIATTRKITGYTEYLINHFGQYGEVSKETIETVSSKI